APAPTAASSTPEPAGTAPDPSEPAAQAESLPASPPSPSPPSAPPQPSFEPRTVVVPGHEQLKPETVMRGVVEDILKERTWISWVVVAFLLGYVFGRLRR